MNLRNIFGRKSRASLPPSVAEPATHHEPLDLVALDHCVGGKSDARDVGVYMKTSKPASH